MRPHEILFPRQAKLVKEGKCPHCEMYIGQVGLDLRNEISRKEFKISGLCQACQDKVFGKD